MATPATTPASNKSSEQTLNQLQQWYYYLDDHFSYFINMCRTDDQRDQLKNELIVSRDAYMKAQNQILQENDSVLSAMTNQIANLQTQIDSAIRVAGNITSILGLIASATGLAAKIVTLVTG